MIAITFSPNVHSVPDFGLYFPTIHTISTKNAKKCNEYVYELLHNYLPTSTAKINAIWIILLRSMRMSPLRSRYIGKTFKKRCLWGKQCGFYKLYFFSYFSYPYIFWIIYTMFCFDLSTDVIITRWRWQNLVLLVKNYHIHFVWFEEKKRLVFSCTTTALIVL